MTSACPRRMMLAALADRMRARRARGDMREAGAAEAELHRDLAEAAFAMSIGTRNGESRDGPRSSISNTCSISVSRPPTPVAIAVPTRSGSATFSSFASLSACADGRDRVVREPIGTPDVLAVHVRARSNSLTSPAICVSYGDGSKRVMRRDAAPTLDRARPRSSPRRGRRVSRRPCR